VIDLSLPANLPEFPLSAQQLARESTERWVYDNLYCVNCGRRDLERLRAGTPFRDFECGHCDEPFELKSTGGQLRASIPAGGYDRSLEAFRQGRVPSFLLLSYSSADRRVTDLLAVNRALISQMALRRRERPLGRPGRENYYLSSLDLSRVPECARVPIVRHGFERPIRFVRQSWDRFAFVRKPAEPEDRDWIRDILSCIARLPGREFTLGELYGFEPELAALYPNNRHIRDKVRQKLQVLCRKGVLRRIVSGVYESVL
jgi:type II restriction enzyme